MEATQANKLFFASDYQEGAHPAILQRFVETNLVSSPGYGTDDFCTEARERIREACGTPEAGVFFLTGGTQANATVIDAMLRPWEGVVAADSGHISVHEAGAIEAGGHKVLTLPGKDGMINAAQLRSLLETFHSDGNKDHMVWPGMVYLSQPTEFGTLYSLEALTDIHEVCREYGIRLYVDGARLAYALASPVNDVSLADLGRLCDAFYIGGTKCGAFFGEAVVLPDPELIPHFFTIIKQHGALFAKGRLMGLQFGTLFDKDPESGELLYAQIGRTAIAAADRLREVLIQKGYTLCFGSPTNQVFVLMENKQLERLGRSVEYSFWETYGEDHTIIRLASSWATRMEDVERLAELL